MRLVDRQEAEAAIEVLGLVDHLEACHREGRAATGDILLSDPDPTTGASMLCRAAWRSGRALGIKFGPIMPANAARGLPTIHTLVALFDGITGAPVAVIDGHPITNWKTAADSALGQRHLAREGSRRLLMVGAGTLAPYLVRAHLAVRPSLTEVAIWNRSPERARALAANLAEAGIAAAVTEDLEAAVRAADVISTATMASEPLVRGAWLKPGAHLDLVGSFLPEMREADREATRRGRLFVDSREGTVGRCGELLDAFADGLDEAGLGGDLYEICGEGRGRSDGEEITLFKNAGGGHLDLMTAEYVAKRLGLAGAV